MKIGDRVTYHYWHAGELRGYSATIISVFPPDEGPVAVALEVEFTDDVIATGILASQSCARQRTREENDVHASGSWSPL